MPVGGQFYRGFTEPEFTDDAAGVGKALLEQWRNGTDTVLDHRAKPEDTTVYAHRGCLTCQAIRRDWRDHDTWQERSYWKPLRDAVPTDVLLDMSIAEIHAIHHLGEPGYADAVIFAGIRVLVHYFTSQDTVSRAELNRRLTEQAGQHWAELDKVKATAHDEVRAGYQAQLNEAHVRIANIEALVTIAFRAHHKTMRYDEVRAAINWRTGEELPAATVQRQREIREAQGRTPR